MTVKFDHVAHRARFNKDKPPKEYIDAYRSGIDLEEMVKNAERKKGDGEFTAKAKEKIDVRARRFDENFRALMNGHFAFTSEVATELQKKNDAHLKTLPRHQNGKKRLPEKASKPKLIGYEIAALARFALTPEERAEKLQEVIDKAKKFGNGELLQSCIAAGIDFDIREPLGDLIGVMNKKDRARYLNESKEKRMRISAPKEKSSLEKDLDSLEKKIARTGKMESAYDVSILLKFETLEEKIKEENPETQSRFYQKMVHMHPIEEDRYHYQSQAMRSAETMKDGASKGRRFIALRNNAINEEFRMNAHEMAVKHMSFRDLAHDAVSLRNKDIKKYAQDPIVDAADYYAMNLKSQDEIDQRKKSLEDKRLYEKLKPLVLRPLMAGY